MADLKTTNIYGDAYINNKVGIATNAPATRLQIGQLLPTAATEGIQFGDDTSARIYRDSSTVIKVSGGFTSTTFINAGNYLQTSGNLIYPASQTATQRLEVGNASGNAWIDGLTIAQGGNVTVYNNLTTPTATVSGYITFPNDTTAAGLINTAGTAWLRLDDGGGNMHMGNVQSGAGIYCDSNAFYWRTINGATTLLSLNSNGDLGAARYLSGTYVTTSDDTSSTTVSYIMAKFGDNYHRSATAAKVAAFLNNQTMSIAGNAATATALTSMNISQFTNNSGYLTSAVTSAVAGTGISVSGATGAVTITNTGVTNISAGTGIGTSASTGAVTITNNGVTSALAGTGVGVSGATGAVTFSIGQAVGTANSPTFAGLTLSPSATSQFQLNSPSATQGLWIRSGYDTDGTATPVASANNIEIQSSGATSGTFSFVCGNTKILTIAPGAVNSLVALQQSGNQVLHAGNVSTYALPIGGGTITGNSTFSADNYLTFGPNSSWSRYLRIGGNGYTAPVTTMASVVTTNGNLHLDAAKAAGMAIYLNWYGGAGGTIFGNGSGTQVGAVDGSGNTSFIGTLGITGAITGASFSGAGTGLTGTAASLTAGAVTNGVYTNTNNTLTAINTINNSNNTVINTLSGNLGLTMYQATTGTDAYMTFHISGDFAAYFGLGGAENDLVYGGWSVGNVRHRILHSGNAPYAWNMNQYVRTTDSPTFASLLITSEISISKHNPRNLLIQGSGGGDSGLLGRGSSGQFAFQVYGSGGGDYGFLNSAWGGWDLQKTVSGNLYLNANGTYYLNPASLTNLLSLTVANTITGAVSGNAGTVTNGLYTTGGQTIAGITYFSNGESINAYGIRGRFTNEYLHLYNKVGIGSPNGWGQGETSTPNYGLSTYGGLNIAYGDNGISTFNGVIRANSNIRQGADLAMPLSSWSVAGTSTGMVIFSFPGNTGNYGMVHCVFDIYEYNSNTVSTVIVGGHNWNGAWYNFGANVIGRCGKSVRLGVKDSKFCVVFGGAASSWDYGTIVLRKIHNGGFYTGVMDMGGSFTTQQTATESFSNISGDLRLLRTSADFIADGGISGTTGTFSSNLSIAGDHQIRNANPTIIFRDTNERTAYIHVNSNVFYVLSAVADSGYGSWAQVANSRWPLEINLSNNNAVFGGIVDAISFTGAGTGLTGTAASLTVGAVTNGIYTTSVIYIGTTAITMSRSSAAQTLTGVSIDGSANSLAADTSTRFKVITFTGEGGDSGNGNAATNYGIYQQGGSWTYPYPDLCIGFHTGIKIGAQTGYGGIRFYNTETWGTEIFSVGNGDNNVRVVNTIYAAAFSGPLTGNVTGNLSGNVTGTAINIAGNGAGYDPYGTIGVTEPAGASNYSYYGLTRQSNIGCGFGLTGTNGALGLGANAFWFGSATSTAAGVMGSAYIAFNGSSLVAVGTVDATQFRDSADTAYFVDPAGTSNLNQWTTLTAARLGRSRYWTNRVAYTANADYYTGTNGWGADEGTWANAWKGGFSGWDIWGTSTEHPQGAGYIHAQGIVSGLHASTTDGGAAYGWMMVGAHNATDNRYWLRGKWAGSTSGWVEMLTSGNYNSFSPTLTGTGASGTWSINVTGNASGTAGSISGFNNPAVAATANTIVYRDGSGHIYGGYILGSYFNASAGNSENPTIGQIWTQNTTDTYLRKSTPAHFRSQVTDGSYPSLTGANASGTWSINITGNAGTATSATSATTATTTTGNAGSVTYLPGRTDATAYPVLWGAAYTNAVGTIAYSCAAVNIQSSTGILSATSFSGAGTGLTGTAASLTAGAANSVAWTNVSGRPTAVSSFTNDSGYLTSVAIANGSVTLAKIENITAYTILGNSNASAAATPAALSVATVATMLSGQTMNINGSSTSCSGNAATATLATKASTLSQGGGTGTGMTFNWSGQGGQPTWLWGSNDGSNIYVWNPSNFSVNYATSAGSATSAGTATSAGSATTAGSCSGNAATATNVAASGITGQTGMWTSAARPGPYRLYRNDDDSAYNVQLTWQAHRTSYWSLRGFLNDGFHAECFVVYSGYADSAGSAGALTTGNTYQVASLGIGVAASNKLHINGDGSNPTIRIDNTAFGSGTSSSRGFFGWLPISIDGNTRYIQLYS